MSDRSHFADNPRRGFLRWVSGGLMALVGAALAVPAAALLGTPLRRKTVFGADTPLPVAELDKLPEGVPVRATLVAPRVRDAWEQRQNEPLGAIWLVRRGSEVRALSSTCPHAGCFVDWSAHDHRFACPCHGSVFSVDGERVAGPSPRPMDSLEVKVEGGRVLVRFQRFREASPTKEPV